MKKPRLVFYGVLVLIMFILGGICSCCESCNRGVKSFKSDFSGLHRTATLMDYNGDTIKTWTGTFDIRDQGNDNQIFFDLDGKRVWIQGGIFISEEH